MFCKILRATNLMILITVFVSCESEKDRLEKSKQVVVTFLTNTSIENSHVLNELYPTINMVGEYYLISDFKILSASINKDKIVTVTCKSPVGNLLFVLKKVNGEYKIINSKGLSPYFKKNIYKYCKSIGCISAETYDADVATICQKKKIEFDELSYKIKSNIEESFKIENNNLKVDGLYFGAGYLSGSITIKNHSRFSVPYGSYKLYYDFLDEQGNTIFTKEEISYKNILYGESFTESLFVSNAAGFEKIKIRLNITSTEFIEKIIVENISGHNCHHNTNIL